MKVDVFLNQKARSGGSSSIERKLREALFRCELSFHQPDSVAEMQKEIGDRAKDGTDFLVICGGDGTLNAALRPLVELRATKAEVPPLCLIPAGTANDLANALKISRRIDRAARAILEGGVRTIDVLEITSSGKTAYMITNGGVGLPSRTARRANFWRVWVRSQAENDKLPAYLQKGFQLANKAVQLAGSKIYEALLVGDIATWDRDGWEVEIEVPGKASFTTRAPFIMINNQPSLGGSFKAAPFTVNNDGTFNVLMVQPTKLLPLVQAVLDIRLGKIPDVGVCPSFEAAELKIASRESSRAISFFGDGEILHKKARELRIRCLHPGLPVVTMGDECPAGVEGDAR